jgi:acetyl/propionyl-CoA carboxylase alpha subunit
MDDAMIRSVLVPNRGEIAIRIARSCREMGIRTIWAHAASEATAWPRRFFDAAASLGEGDVRATYLNVGRIIDVAREAGADAIHPGYGFLSERAELAAACADAGIVFIGPPAAAIEAMGSKAGSRVLMERLGVPVVPGYHGDEQNDARFEKEAEAIGYPILVKASAGGGGKGMKIAWSRADLKEALASARREAERAFGNDRLLLERFVQRPRHVEFQVFGDAQGNVVHLFERDCSIQRRHQKVIEESPAPRFPEELRRKMAKSAVDAARGVGYRNAGTVEFILTPDGEYYFLEMNTRLQVEHPVTEMVLGVDLVRAQIEVAAGKPLPWGEGALAQRGHAVEARIYAEDADEGFLPQTGVVRRFDVPAGPGLRLDSGVGAGSEVTVSFDPMLAKLTAHAETRELAIERLATALEQSAIFGVTTNTSYLRRVLRHPAFIAGDVSTHFITEQERDLHRKPSFETAAVAALLAPLGSKARSAESASGAQLPTIWEQAGGWGR